MSPKASVIIPVYNRAHSILPTLRSVQAQTMGDFECIVVDDGSADGHELRRVIEGLGDRRFRYVRRNNGGGGAARNTGIDEAQGEIIALLDSDDRWHAEKLQLDLDGGAARRVVFSAVQVERGGRIIGERPAAKPRLHEPVAEYLACRGGFVPTSTLALPRELAKRTRYDETISFGQDTDFAIRLAAAGAEFSMLQVTATVMSDDETGDRLSRSKNWSGSMVWLDRVKPSIGTRAYFAYRGSQVARMAANSGRYGTALRFFGAALRRGALSPNLAAKSLGQIILPRSAYSKLVNGFVAIFGK